MHDMTKADRLADKKLVEQLSKGIGSKRSIVKLGSSSGGTAMGPKTPKKMQKKVMDANLEPFKRYHKFKNKNKSSSEKKILI